jgi:ABC-type uncharacterized transport system involved in gliding motility auxiliary subunit
MHDGEGDQMSGRRFALVVGAALLLLVIAINLVGGVWLRNARLDLTERQLYSLSAGSKQVLANLAEPLELRFYFSREAASGDPQITAYAARVRELLQSFVAHANGRLRLVEIDPEPFSEEEQQARLAGLQPFQPPGADPIFLGLSGANAVDDRRQIPGLDPSRETFLEYDITRLIYDLDNPDPVKVALITSLPIDPQGTGGFMDQGRPQVFAEQLGSLMQVETLTPDFTAIPADTDVLVIIHPWPMNPAQEYAVDQFVLRKGRAFFALDPASVMSLTGPDPNNPFGPPPPPRASNLAGLLGAWGVEMSADVVLDREGGFRLGAPDPSGQSSAMTYPLFLQITPDRMDRDNMITGQLGRDVVFGLAGALSVSERQGRTATTLARTAGDTMRLPPEMALQQPDPMQLEQMWQGIAKAEIVGLQLSGTLATAYPNGPPAEAGLPTDAERLTQSATPAEVVIFSDADWVMDQFYINPTDGSFVFDNLFLALNAIDRLGGSDALISLRSRAPASRRMTQVDQMEADAREAYQLRLESAEAEQRATEERLATLQSRGQGSGFFNGDMNAELTPEEQSEMNRFLSRAEQLGDEVRQIRRDLRRNVDRLQAWVVGLNVWLGPLLVGLLGVFVFTRRARRARASEAKA